MKKKGDAVNVKKYTDEMLVSLFHERSEEAITAASEKYGSYCNRIAYNILHDSGEAEECVNDALLAAWNTIPPKKPLPFAPYLARIARNIALGRYERARAMKRGAGEADAVLDELSEIIAAEDCTESIVSRIAFADTMNTFLATLPSLSRDIFVSRYFAVASCRDIARQYGISEERVRVTLHRTREKLRKILEKEGIL